MAKHTITYSQLLSLRNDIINQQKTSAAFFFFNMAKVERFFSENKFPLTVMDSRMDEFVKRYVRLDKDGQPVTEERDGILHYSFYSKEYEDNYKKAIGNFLSLKITIQL